MTVIDSPATADVPATPAPRPAASVVLLRDGAQGLEVLLLRRHQASGVLGGMYVFPGGKLDAADALPMPAGLDRSPPELHGLLGEADLSNEQAQGLFVAAMRETFEEAGVWLAEPAGPTAFAHSAAVARLKILLAEGHPWPQALVQVGWRWRSAALQPWTRWITPPNPPVGTPRFDTRFFLARLPHGQQVQHDNHEATEALWITPRTALERYWARELGLIAPQLMGLAQLARHDSVDSAWAEAASRPPPCILPHTFSDEGHKAMCYPGDPLHALSQRVLPGPTRLRFIAGRFEPVSGFEGWFH